jgi:hypothetical protein
MSEETPNPEVPHVHTPSCCRREPDPTQHPNWLAWLEDARAKIAAGASDDQIEAFCGEPVAVVKSN